jgi:hypothetical protein
MKMIKCIISGVMITIASAVLLVACSKKDNPTPTTNTATDTGSVYMEVFNMAGSSNLKLNNEWYINQNSDSFTVSKFNYYISNIKLNGSGTTATYTEAESYHLIEHSSVAAQMAFSLKNVPAGKYTSITFMIGVDSLRNVSGAQTGALDPVNGNFWSWNTGYIMLKFEGNSPKAPTADGKLMMHCGGFAGANNVLKTVKVVFPNEITVAKNSVPHVHLKADVLQIFKSPNVIDFATTTTIHMPGAAALKLAENYASMFTVTYAGL